MNDGKVVRIDKSKMELLAMEGDLEDENPPLETQKPVKRSSAPSSFFDDPEPVVKLTLKKEVHTPDGNIKTVQTPITVLPLKPEPKKEEVKSILSKPWAFEKEPEVKVEVKPEPKQIKKPVPPPSYSEYKRESNKAIEKTKEELAKESRLFQYLHLDIRGLFQYKDHVLVFYYLPFKEMYVIERYLQSETGVLLKQEEDEDPSFVEQSAYYKSMVDFILYENKEIAFDFETDTYVSHEQYKEILSERKREETRKLREAERMKNSKVVGIDEVKEKPRFVPKMNNDK